MSGPDRAEAVASIVHELRTPLTAIRALAELMLDTPDMTARDRAEFLTIIAAESLRLGRLVDGILDEARAAAAPMGELSLTTLIEDAVAIMAGSLREAGVELTLDLDPAAAVIADRDGLLQVLLNLISNALRAVPAGTGRITVTLREAPGAQVIRVADNGPGVPEAEREAIFQPWRQISRGETPQGTGLGLPVSRRIVERHGGRLVAGAAPGGGACFTLTLPTDGPRKEGAA